jgi:hypothetical protein
VKRGKPTPREEHRLRVSENRVLKKLFGRKRKKVGRRLEEIICKFYH